MSTYYSYNQQGELVGKNYTDETPSASISYDATGHPSLITDAGGAHHLSYNALGQIIGETGLAASGTMSYSYDALGRSAGYVFQGPEGQANLAATYGYSNATGQLTTVSSGGRVVTYNYDPGSGWLAQTQNPPLVAVRSPDEQGRILNLTTHAGGSVLGPVISSSTYTYDAHGRRTQHARESGAYWQYGYSGRSELTSAVNHYANGNEIPGQSFAYAYDAIGNRIRAIVNGAAAAYMANPTNQYGSREVPPRVEVQGKVSFRSGDNVVLGVNGKEIPADANGVFYESIPVDNSDSAKWQETRIAVVSKLAGPQGRDVTEKARGHIFVPRNPEAFTYDADGNLASDGRWNYSWDGENRLVRLDTTALAISAGVPRQNIEFGYDFHGRRIAKRATVFVGNKLQNESSLVFAYDCGWNLIAEFDGMNSKLKRSYVWGIDISGSRTGAGGVGGLVSSQSETQVFLPVYDGNGNVIASRDAASGIEQDRLEYGPFGELLQESRNSTLLNPIGFSTRYRDQETGLVSYGFRYYEAGKGRWLSRDPLGETVFATHYAMGKTELARERILREALAPAYQFVRNNPVSFVDAMGLTCISRLSVIFEYSTPPPKTRMPYWDALAQGRVFYGATYAYGNDGKLVGGWGVVSGGFRAPESRVRAAVGATNDDTSVPSGKYTVQTTLTGSAVRGYLVNETGLRSAIFMHAGSISEGCIVFRDDFDDFSKDMQDTHDISNREVIPIEISYRFQAGANPPVGNQGKGKNDPGYRGSDPDPVQPDPGPLQDGTWSQ